MVVLVVASGVFEFIHPGHILYLRESRKLGDKLVVIVARDRIVKNVKGEVTVPEHQRLEVVKSLKPVDDAILGDEDDNSIPIRKLNPDIIAVGPDQYKDLSVIEDILARAGVEADIVRIVDHWKDGLYSSGQIKSIYSNKN